MSLHYLDPNDEPRECITCVGRGCHPFDAQQPCRRCAGTGRLGNPEAMRRHCDSCEVAYINGVRCHEHGCPDAWADAARECKECDSTFRPLDHGQRFCSEECECSHWGLPYQAPEFA